MEVALQPRMIQFSLAPAYQPSRTPQERNRRSIYAYRVRGQADPFLEVFNQPNPNDSCDLRDSAAVSPQAFTLLNSDLMTDRSHRLRAAGGEGREGARRASEACLPTRARSRADRQRKRERLTKYVREDADLPPRQRSRSR